jgi:hypothetical protein
VVRVEALFNSVRMRPLTPVKPAGGFQEESAGGTAEIMGQS